MSNTKVDFVFLKQEIECPIVYRFWLESEIVYIGASSRGLSRPLDRGHKIHQDDDFDYDRLEIFKQIDDEDAFDLEDRWIREFKPKFNIIQFKKKEEDEGPWQDEDFNEDDYSEGSNADSIYEERYAREEEWERETWKDSDPAYWKKWQR
jgi:hypothetical protein